MEAQITFSAALVRVADERHEVPGAKYTVSGVYDPPISGEVIPPEGGSPDTWLGYPGVDLDQDLWDSLASAAVRGARGESGQIIIDIDE